MIPAWITGITLIWLYMPNILFDHLFCWKWFHRLYVCSLACNPVGSNVIFFPSKCIIHPVSCFDVGNKRVGMHASLSKASGKKKKMTAANLQLDSVTSNQYHYIQIKTKASRSQCSMSMVSALIHSLSFSLQRQHKNPFTSPTTIFK